MVIRMVMLGAEGYQLQNGKEEQVVEQQSSIRLRLTTTLRQRRIGSWTSATSSERLRCFRGSRPLQRKKATALFTKPDSVTPVEDVPRGLGPSYFRSIWATRGAKHQQRVFPVVAMIPPNGSGPAGCRRVSVLLGTTSFSRTGIGPKIEVEVS